LAVQRDHSKVSEIFAEQIFCICLCIA
jgi:hypothetical protein